MTKAGAARERVYSGCFGHLSSPSQRRDCEAHLEPFLTAYGDRRAVEAEIATLRAAVVATSLSRIRAMLADAEQREKDLP